MSSAPRQRPPKVEVQTDGTGTITFTSKGKLFQVLRDYDKRYDVFEGLQDAVGKWSERNNEDLGAEWTVTVTRTVMKK